LGARVRRFHHQRDAIVLWTSSGLRGIDVLGDGSVSGLGITRMGNGNASRIGKAVELLIAASCILASYGELNASCAMVDDEGVDLMFHRRSGTATVAVQVKARTMDTTVLQKERFQADVRPSTFRPLDNRFLLFVAVDMHEATFGPVWLIPSRIFQEQAFQIGNGKFRFTASMKADSVDRWRRYRLSKSELHLAILKIMAQREAQQRPAWI
jgi:hypothetical protein